jgi:hypothetical protein
MPATKQIPINFILNVTPDAFKKLLKSAQELGLDYEDAGPQLTVTRYIMSEGFSALHANELEPDWNIEYPKS